MAFQNPSDRQIIEILFPRHASAGGGRATGPQPPAPKHARCLLSAARVSDRFFAEFLGPQPAKFAGRRRKRRACGDSTRDSDRNAASKSSERWRRRLFGDRHLLLPGSKRAHSQRDDPGGDFSVRAEGPRAAACRRCCQISTSMPADAPKALKWPNAGARPSGDRSGPVRPRAMRLYMAAEWCRYGATRHLRVTRLVVSAKTGGCCRCRDRRPRDGDGHDRGVPRQGRPPRTAGYH